MEVPRGAFHLDTKGGRMIAAFTGREFLPKHGDGCGKVVSHSGRLAQVLYGVPAFGDRFTGLIDRAIESFLSFCRTFREQVRNGLEPEKQSVKALQQRVVQVPRDACPFADARFEAHVELMSLLAEAEPMK